MRYWKPILLAVFGAVIVYHVSSNPLNTGLFAFFATLAIVLIWHEIRAKI